MSDLIIEVSGPSCPRLLPWDGSLQFVDRPRRSQPARAIPLGRQTALPLESTATPSTFRATFRVSEKDAAQGEFALALDRVACLLFAQERVDEATDARIRSEEMEHSSSCTRCTSWRTDRPACYRNAESRGGGEVGSCRIRTLGHDECDLEPRNFGHPGWLNERASGFIVAPVRQNLKFEVLAWTPSTHGTVTPVVNSNCAWAGDSTANGCAGTGGGGGAFGGGRAGRGGPQYQQPTRERLDAGWPSTGTRSEGEPYDRKGGRDSGEIHLAGETVRTTALSHVRSRQS